MSELDDSGWWVRMSVVSVVSAIPGPPSGRAQFTVRPLPASRSPVAGPGSGSGRPRRRFTLRWGRAIGVYLVWYGAGRTVFEVIRIDPASDSLFGIPADDVASLVAVALGVAILIMQTRRHPGPEGSIRQDGRAPAPPPVEPAAAAPR